MPEIGAGTGIGTSCLLLQDREVGGAIGGGYHDLAVEDGGADVDQVGVGRDLLEAVGPVVASPGEDLDVLVGDVELNAVAVELDLVKPALAGRDLLGSRCESRLDEAGERGLGADGRWFLTLNARRDSIIRTAR